MKRTNLDQEGITLIALVVTIVILLILAGVGITSITGEKEIIKESRNAKELAEKAALEEQIEAAILIAKQKHRNPALDDVIDEIKNSKIITNHEQVNRETGAVTTDLGYVIEGKLDDYIGKDVPGGNGDSTDLAKDVLKTNPEATDATIKSPYVMYNGMLCRVLYDATSEYGLQIITANQITRIKLGEADDTVTESDFSYTGSATLDKSTRKAAASYNKFVDRLNDLAKTYMDTKGIAKEARCVGSSPDYSADTTNMYVSDGTYAYINRYGFSGICKDKDSKWTMDFNRIRSLELFVDFGYTLLASRDVICSSDKLEFCVREMPMKADSIGSSPLFYLKSGGTGVYIAESGLTNSNFRPVFSISAEAKVVEGNGTSENPYVLGL